MYSNSRIQSFEQCPRKYKFRYIDNIRTDREGIEAFVGKRVHETLEKLYTDLKFSKLDTLDELLSYYESIWEKNWHGKIAIVREGISPGHYFKTGYDCIRQYYQRYQPFNQGKTLGLEERIEMKIKNDTKQYSIQGYIDRLTWIPETETYEIHDYKTGATVPTQEEVDQDRQLALYQLGILQRWPDAKNIVLIWHYLVADRELRSTRTIKDLQTLEKEVIDVIHQIEAESARGAWDVKISALCGWCEYKSICPAFKHEATIETLPPNLYLQDSGVKLVQTYSSLEEEKSDYQAKIKKIEEEQRKVEEAAIAYATKEGVTVLDGPGYKLQIKSEDEFKVPRKSEDPFAWELLRTTLKNASKLEDVSTVNGAMLKYALKKGAWPEGVVKTIRELVKQEIRKTFALIKK